MAPRSDDLAASLARLLAHDPVPGLAAAYLFRSHAEGRTHGESDVDVGVLFAWAVHPTAAARFDAGVLLSSRLAAGLRTPNVDLVVLNDAPPGLARRVVTAGVPLRVADAALEHAFRRDAQLRAADLEPFLRRARAQARRPRAMTPYLVERLAELRRHLDHLRTLRPRVTSREALERDLSLHNDVLFSLLTVCQLVIDVAGDLSARRGDRFEDYTQAVRNLARDPRFPASVVRDLEPLPGFRNVLLREYVALDLQRAVDALDRLEPVERFLAIVRDVDAGDQAAP
jgi:uncharacterized protein YutE (UPF0331/DUF86 family)/predicted nucleotidyltransferase